MKYCQYCGTKLEDGQQCTCRPAAPAQQPVARSAAIPPKQHFVLPKAVLNQQQKNETQGTMAQAGEPAGAVGEGMQNPAGAYGASFAGSAQNTLPKRAAAQGKRGSVLYRVLMIAFGALHVLFFFVLSYARLDDRGNIVKFVAQFMGTDVRSRLTALNLIRLMKGCAEWGVRNADAVYVMFLVLFGLPVLFGVLLIVLNCVKKSGGMTGSIVLSALTLVCYLMAYLDMFANAENLGYEMGLGIGLVAVVVVLQIVVAVMGHIAGRKALANKINPQFMQAVNTSRIPAAEVPVSAMYPSAPSAPASYVPAAPVSQTSQAAPVPAAPVSAEYTPAPPAPAVSLPQASPAPSRNLFCMNCGARLLGDSKFCGSCGAPVASDPNAYGQ